MSHPYPICNLLPASEGVLLNDVYLILLPATRIPPHLLVSVKGKILTLTAAGAKVDGDLSALLHLIRSKRIPSIFIRLSAPPVFTMDDLRARIRKYMLAYPRVDIGIATCLAPIKDFCGSVYKTRTGHVNFVYELLPELFKQKVAGECYQMFLDLHLVRGKFFLSKYSMSDIFDGIRKTGTEIAA